LEILVKAGQLVQGTGDLSKSKVIMSGP